MNEPSLLDDLILKSNRHGITFLHLNSDAQQQLTGDAELDRLRPIHSAEDLRDADPAQVVCWMGFADGLSSEEAVSYLGLARSVIHSWRDAGGRICLVSRHPRISFPECRGSSVLSDAYLVKADMSALTVWSAQDDPETRREALRDLGAEALAFLDMLINELDAWNNLEESLGSPLEWEALEGAGVLHRRSGGRVESFVRSGVLRPALEAAIAEVFQPQADFARVVQQLFSMERLIRHAVRVQAAGTFGRGWRASLLSGDLQGRVLERARPDFGPPATIKSIRDPMEWVTLGELIDLAGSDKLGLGVPAATWRRMADEILPVRNRVGHMRLIRRSDAQRTSSWLAASRRVHAAVLRSSQNPP